MMKNAPGDNLLFPVISGITVDLAALTALAHECRPELCRDAVSCCACYEIGLDRRELNRIIGLLPQAARFAPHLKDGNEFVNIFEEESPNYFTIDATPEGSCWFSYRDSLKSPLCSLHSAALELNLEPAAVKPLGCLLWPLSLTEKPRPVLSVHEDALAFPCNRRRDHGETGLDLGVTNIIKSVWGTGFTDKLLTVIHRSSRVDRPCHMKPSD